VGLRPLCVRETFIHKTSGANLAAAGNGDGIVGACDHSVGRAHFGQIALGSGALTEISFAVAEPSPMALVWRLMLAGGYVIAAENQGNRRSRSIDR
jgi:hypothetical protein